MMTPCEGCTDPGSLQDSDEQLLARKQGLYAESDAIHNEGGDDDPRLKSIENKVAVIDTVRDHATEIACLPWEGCTRDQYLQCAIRNLATRSQVSI